MDRGNAIKTPVISSDQWTWIPVPMATLQTPSEHSIQLTVSGGAVEVDKIKLAPLAAPSPEGTREAR
ncbi:MAG: hypothetical protein EBX52_06780 [Proteobacteria bacterium]|nr:hypothetical protein [Pseudomonadota bacterium]